jgi:hypothetical protein
LFLIQNILLELGKFSLSLFIFLHLQLFLLELKFDPSLILFQALHLPFLGLNNFFLPLRVLFCHSLNELLFGLLQFFFSQLKIPSVGGSNFCLKLLAASIHLDSPLIEFP